MGESDDTIFRLQIYTKYKCLNTKIGKTIKQVAQGTCKFARQAQRNKRELR